MPSSALSSPLPLPFTLQHASLSDVGRRRTANEDAYLAQPLRGVFAVADGMGGHAGGQVAAQLALSTLSGLIAAAPDSGYAADASLAARAQLLGWLAQTVDAVNAAVHERARSQADLGGMGCTLCVALLRGRSAFIAHVGDSRIYLRRGGVTYQLTEDHSFSRELVGSGLLTEADVAAHPQRHVLMRAIGVLPKVHADTAFVELAAGDTLLLCSDGLHGEVADRAIDAALDTTPPEQAARLLVRAALDAGGKDNVTVVVVRLLGTLLPEPAVLGSALARAALVQSALFAACSESELVRVQQLALTRRIPAAGQALVQGTASAELLIILTGQLAIWRDDQRLGVLGPGEPFGALALVPDQAPATYCAETDSLLLVFPLAELRRVLAADPTLAAKLALAALARLCRRVDELAAAPVKHSPVDVL